MPAEQKPYEEKAEWLLDKGHVERMAVEELAKRIYEKE